MLYLDNAATSFPKPPEVARAMAEYLETVGATVNRSSYGAAQEAELTALRLRQRLARFFRHPDPSHVILTPGNTYGLNQVLRGFLRPGDHCLVSAMEHNAVMRPLNDLLSCGVSFDRVPCGRTGRFDPSDILPLLRPNTKLFVLAHASNVSGTVQDAEAVGRICLERGIAFCLDGAQSAGHVPIDFTRFHLSALSVPGHKGLLGPSGTGALLLAPGFAEKLTPLVTGGTGSASDSEEQPVWMPDRFEAGTPNIPGIYGLEAALAFLEEAGSAAVNHDRALCRRFLNGLGAIPNVRLAGPDTPEERVAVFSLDFSPLDNAEAADRLEREFGVLTRCGLHCAPSAHKTLGTYPAGTVRLSFGFFNTEADAGRALEAVAAVSAG